MTTLTLLTNMWVNLLLSSHIWENLANTGKLGQHLCLHLTITMPQQRSYTTGLNPEAQNRCAAFRRYRTCRGVTGVLPARRAEHGCGWTAGGSCFSWRSSEDESTEVILLLQNWRILIVSMAKCAFPNIQMACIFRFIIGDADTVAHTNYVNASIPKDQLNNISVYLFL